MDTAHGYSSCGHLAQIGLSVPLLTSVRAQQSLLSLAHPAPICRSLCSGCCVPRCFAAAWAMLGMTAQRSRCSFEVDVTGLRQGDGWVEA